MLPHLVFTRPSTVHLPSTIHPLIGEGAVAQVVFTSIGDQQMAIKTFVYICCSPMCEFKYIYIR